MSEPNEVVVLELDRLEALDLKRHLADIEGVELEKRPVSDDSVGVLDPITLICIPLGALAIQALIVWLAKRRTETKIEETVEVRRPDGTVETRTMSIRLRDSQADEQAAKILQSLKVPRP